MILQPQRAFEVEIVGRFVEQEQVGLAEQHGRERDPHAPAAGELRARALEIGVGKAEAGKDGGGAGGSGMRGDVGQAGVQLSDSVRIGRRFRLREQRGALAIGGEHKIKKRLWPVRALPAAMSRCSRGRA